MPIYLLSRLCIDTSRAQVYHEGYVEQGVLCAGHERLIDTRASSPLTAHAGASFSTSSGSVPMCVLRSITSFFFRSKEEWGTSCNLDNNSTGRQLRCRTAGQSVVGNALHLLIKWCQWPAARSVLVSIMQKMVTSAILVRRVSDSSSSLLEQCTGCNICFAHKFQLTWLPTTFWHRSYRWSVAINSDYVLLMHQSWGSQPSPSIGGAQTLTLQVSFFLARWSQLEWLLCTTLTGQSGEVVVVVGGLTSNHKSVIKKNKY